MSEQNKQGTTIQVLSKLARRQIYFQIYYKQYTTLTTLNEERERERERV